LGQGDFSRTSTLANFASPGLASYPMKTNILAHA
jgi:hypothetical protein